MILEIIPTQLLEHQLQRLATVKNELPGIISDELMGAGSEMVADLSDASPRSGIAESAPPEGDASGPLAESFSSDVQSDGGTATLTIKTTQPTKLKFVRYGTGIYGPIGGRIYPKVKRALYWEGAAHPVKSVAGQKPNDFVSPITDEAGSVINDRVVEAISQTMQLLVS